MKLLNKRTSYTILSALSFCNKYNRGIELNPIVCRMDNFKMLSHKHESEFTLTCIVFHNKRNKLVEIKMRRQ